MSVFNFIERLKFERKTGQLSDMSAFIVGLLVAIMLVLFARIHPDFKSLKITPVTVVVFVLSAGGFNILANRTRKGFFNAKKQVYKEEGHDANTALIVQGQR